MMTDSARTPQKQHGRRHTSSHDHRVVTRAAIHPMHRITALFNGTRQLIRETRIHLDCGLIQARFHGNGQAPGIAGQAKRGLGTSIVEALGRQLGGRVEVSTGPQGTRVSIIHNAVASRLTNAA